MNKILIASLALSLMIIGCSNEKENNAFFREGGYYTSADKDGKYSVIKILVIDENAFHIRIYANKFNAPPKESDIDALTLGGIGSSEGFGLGHAPMAKKGFKESDYSYIGFRKVKPEELDGYNMWKSQ